MSGVIAPVLYYNNRRRASLNARLVVLCETITQLRGAMLVHPKVAENHPADETGEKRMESAIPSVARIPDTCRCSGSFNSRNNHRV
jgi:hypothetical protein